MVGAFVMVATLVAPANASGQFYHTFTTANPYFQSTDGRGTFTAQARTKPGYAVPLAWSWQIAPSLQAIATGNMTCTAGHHQIKVYRDYHPNVPVSYLWHSSFTGSWSDNTKYDLWGECVFPVYSGGRPGTARVSFVFHYSLFCGPCGLTSESEDAPVRVPDMDEGLVPTEPADEAEFSSSVVIIYDA
ncbi:hypothetical protein [Actinokineospora sp. UTMC 2448]|uniref:hypothetical protein n=1 Tax=Actinokineospora sp. UTMC 2448 TaxID=2268449 RepID=UPI0021649510|nr:hypothetical protein [Actinokineospora sp. UTMC 2448]